MKKIVFFLFLLSTASTFSYSQGLSNIQFSVGVNSSSARLKQYGSILLPNFEAGPSEFSYNSGESINYGLLLSWQLLEDKPWQIKSGLSWTNMSFSTSIISLNDERNYFLDNQHTIKQLDLPILLGYKKRISAFEMGMDIGLIKTIWVDSEINQNLTTQTPDSNPDFERSQINPKGFTNFLGKYSFYVAPIFQWNFGKSSGVSLQPFYRIQLGDKGGLIYTAGSGSIRQFGVNLGYNIRL